MSSKRYIIAAVDHNFQSSSDDEYNPNTNENRRRMSISRSGRFKEQKRRSVLSEQVYTPPSNERQEREHQAKGDNQTGNNTDQVRPLAQQNNTTSTNKTSLEEAAQHQAKSDTQTGNNADQGGELAQQNNTTSTNKTSLEEAAQHQAKSDNQTRNNHDQMRPLAQQNNTTSTNKTSLEEVAQSEHSHMSIAFETVL